MKFTATDWIMALLFAGLLVGNVLTQQVIKPEVQLISLACGLVAFASLFAKAPFKTRFPFITMLGTMTVVTLCLITVQLVSAFGSGSQASGDKTPDLAIEIGGRGLLAFLLLTFGFLALYENKIIKNKYIEAAFAAGFMLTTLFCFLLK